MQQTPRKVLYIVVGALAILDFCCVASLCMTLFYKNYADPAVLSALIALTGSLTGSLGSILVNTRQAPMDSTTTTTTTTNPPPPPPPDSPTPVVIEQPKSKPVPTEEVGASTESKP